MPRVTTVYGRTPGRSVCRTGQRVGGRAGTVSYTSRCWEVHVYLDLAKASKKVDSACSLLHLQLGEVQVRLVQTKVL